MLDFSYGMVYIRVRNIGPSCGLEKRVVMLFFDDFLVSMDNKDICHYGSCGSSCYKTDTFFDTKSLFYHVIVWHNPE